jgi:hypothetical protein
MPRAAEKLARMVIVVGAGHESDIKAQRALDFVQFDFWEDRLISHAQRVVPTTIKGTRSDTTEVTNAWDGGAHKTKHEVIHAAATKRDFGADSFTLHAT